MNGCLVKFPGLRCDPVPHVDVVIRGESFASQSLFLGDQKWHNRRERGLGVWRVTENLPLEFLQECRDCVGHIRPCIVVEQNDPMGELAWSFRFDLLAKGGQGLRVTLGIHCYPALQEVYQKGAVFVKEEYQHNLSYTCVDAFGFFGGGDCGCFQWKLSFRFWFEVMTPGLISSHHSCQELIPFPGIALQMINTVGHSTCSLLWLKTVWHPSGARFVPVQS